ncbi:MAG: NADH-quinone oxidoreductase subunit N [Actinomycetota bacterium]
MQPSIDLHAVAPEIVLSGTILLVACVDLFLPKDRKWLSMPLALAGVVATLIVTLTLVGEDRATFGDTFVVNSYALLFKVFFLTVAIAVLLLSLRYFQDGRYYQGEYYFLLLSAFLGCLIMASSRDLLLLFLALELVSAPGFLIAAFRKSDPRSNEAGLKFFLIGVLSSAVMLYGMSLIYGITGTLQLDRIAAALAGNEQAIALAGILFVVAGFAFKVSAVPFHFWAPDTYEGSPIPVAAFLSVASKAAGFAGLLPLMFVAFIHQAEFWAPIFAILAIATMTIGNLVALQQRQVIRLLAYSSVAQAGYILIPFAVAGHSAAVDERALASAVLYILIYGVMNLGAFGVVIAMSREAPGALISDFAGLIHRAPVLAVAMTGFLVSLAGIPPTAGFWAKFFVIGAAIERGGIGIVLAAVLVVNSVISLFYYLAVVRQMIFLEGEQKPLRSPFLVRGVVLAAAVTVFAVGVLPQLFAQFPQGLNLGQ